MVAAAALPGALPVAPARAQPQCTAADFAKAVDEAGANLRAVNAANAPKLQAKIKQLKERKGWSDADYEEKAYDYLADKRLSELDAQANELLVNIDGLGRVPEGSPPDCSKLPELKAAASELLAVMRTKSSYMLAKLDTELAPPTPPPAAKQAPREQAAVPPAAVPPVASPPPAGPAKPAVKPAAPWSAKTEVAPAPTAQVPALPPSAFGDPGAEEGYTIDEIREATRGVFGTASTSLASVLEHAFAKSGRPSAYVLGQEGGGAFLAGLRYGSGTLYMRNGGTRPVYWHGPSVGYDFGAAGSRTLFLIYRLREPGDLFRRFTGLDGSAFLVGGVGITYLKGGDVVMAPIRTGLGLRLGANVGYVRFTEKPTWNPF
jgi:hypothetical protein